MSKIDEKASGANEKVSGVNGTCAGNGKGSFVPHGGELRAMLSHLITAKTNVILGEHRAASLRKDAMAIDRTTYKEKCYRDALKAEIKNKLFMRSLHMTPGAFLKYAVKFWEEL